VNSDLNHYAVPVQLIPIRHVNESFVNVFHFIRNIFYSKLFLHASDCEKVDGNDGNSRRNPLT
jgi:hypothetical protein